KHSTHQLLLLLQVGVLFWMLYLYQAFRELVSVGDSDPPLRKLTTKQENLVGVQKRRLFIHQSHKIPK
ncbi:MAG: hypothetical protein V7L04_08500, partial [Nostoc sp.]|uniref:hypothetical protein n=1 Tax=Nostoc sp. TaxID=1180 RepID=UPI002FF8B19A